MRKSLVNISDCVFFYRATIRNEPFQVGRKVFWDLSKYYYADTTDYDMDPSKVIGRHNLIDDKEEKKEKSKTSLKSQADLLVIKKSYNE